MSPFEVAVLAIAAMFFVAAIVVLAKPHALALSSELPLAPLLRPMRLPQKSTDQQRGRL